MESPKHSTEANQEKNVWEDIRDTVKGGMKDLRNVGDELARQGRLRMDIFQTERRLKGAYEELGKTVHARFSQGSPAAISDPMIAEVNTRISYYLGELKRLQDEMHGTSSGMN